MDARSLLIAIGGATLAASCLVSISDVDSRDEPDGASGSAGSSGSAGTGGAPDASSGGAAGAWPDGGAGVGASGGSGGAGGAGGGSGGVGGTADGGAGAGGSGGSTVGCLLPFKDDFGDGLVGDMWWPSAMDGMKLDESGGQLNLYWPEPSTVTSGYAGIHSKAVYDLSSCSVLVRVVDTPLASTKSYLHFAVTSNTSDNSAEFFMNEGKLHGQIWSAGTPSATFEMQFDASKHSWWRLRGVGQELHWDVSGDGKTWVEIAIAVMSFSLQAVEVLFGGGFYQIEPASAGDAAFDDINLPPP